MCLDLDHRRLDQKANLLKSAMAAVLKLFRSGKEKKKGQSQHYLDIGEIGMPTQVSHNFSGRILPNGTIEGIPDSWRHRLKLMITSEEAENPEKAEKAAQLCRYPKMYSSLQFLNITFQVDRHESQGRSERGVHASEQRFPEQQCPLHRDQHLQ